MDVTSLAMPSLPRPCRAVLRALLRSGVAAPHDVADELVEQPKRFSACRPTRFYPLNGFSVIYPLNRSSALSLITNGQRKPLLELGPPALHRFTHDGKQSQFAA